MKRLANERGQAFVLTALTLAVLLGMTVLVLDVGAWFRTKRRLQATADAAALAGAQALPDTPGTATQWAVTYGDKNGGGVAAADVVITSTNSANDTIAVRAKKSQVGIFSRVFGINLVNIGANAKALVGSPQQAMYVAPMVVYCDHPLIKDCTGKKTPQFNKATSLPYNPLGAPGAFGMLNLDGTQGTVGTSKEAAWILTGNTKYLPLGIYQSDPGAKFSSQNIRGALDARIGTVLLFPVYRTLNGTGQNAKYDIIGWIGFYLTGYTVQGNSATLRGYFTTFIAHGLLANQGNNGSPASFGVKSIQLIG